MGTNRSERLLHAKQLLYTGQASSSKIDFKQRIALFEQSRNLFAQLRDTTEANVAEYWAVQYLLDAGDAKAPARAQALLASANEMKFKILQPSIYYWLGISDFRHNQVSASNRDLKEALRLAEADDNAFEVQHSIEALATGYYFLDEIEPTLFYAGKMLTRREFYYQDPSQYWRDKGTLADISLRLNFSSAAMSFAREALPLAQERWPEGVQVNDSLRRVIQATAATKEVPRALKQAHESLEIAEGRAASAENSRTIAEIYLLIADLEFRAKDYSGALSDYGQALDAYGKVPEITESLYQIHKGKFFCFQNLHQPEEFYRELRTVLKLSEKYRATIREDASRQAFFAGERAVFEAAADDALTGGNSRLAFDRIESSKSRSLLDFVESDKPIAAMERDFGPVAQPLSSAAIQGRLPEQVELVQYAVLPDRVAIWVVTKTRFDLLEKPIASAELDQKVDSYQALITSKAPPDQIRRAGRELYDLLIPPGLERGKQLCLVADTSLHQLSFASLISPADRYLIEDFALSYAPSASVLAVASENAKRRESPRPERMLAIGNPAFDRDENPNLTDLHAAEDEARSVAANYPGSIALFGADATKDQFLKNFTEAEVVHFAGHFVSNPRSPGNAKLLFAGGDLRSNELGAYKLPNARLMILSACETGFERYNKSEGAIGIARTLLALGTPLVVATQWKVDSDATKDLMIAFHLNRKQKGMTSAESLRQAQLEMLSHDATNAPFYWAAFSLFGGYATY